MSEFTIEVCDSSNIETIVDGINRYNLSKVPALSNVWTELNFVIKNKDYVEIAGVLGGIGYWNGLEIKIIWVDENYRLQGLGTRLLKHIEMLAKAKGANVSMLDTFDFQAEKFYIKNGYEVIGEIKDFPKGHKRIYFSKKLN